MAVNQGTNEIFVTNNTSDVIFVIDGDANEVVDTIDVDKEPEGVAVNQLTSRIYVTNEKSNTISVLE